MCIPFNGHNLCFFAMLNNSMKSQMVHDFFVVEKICNTKLHFIQLCFSLISYLSLSHSLVGCFFWKVRERGRGEIVEEREREEERERKWNHYNVMTTYFKILVIQKCWIQNLQFYSSIRLAEVISFLSIYSLFSLQGRETGNREKVSEWVRKRERKCLLLSLIGKTFSFSPWGIIL